MLYSHVTLLMLRVVDVVAKTTVQQSAKMLVGEVPGDIQIGALFPMHRQIAGTEACGAIWEQYGIQRAEIAVLTVKELNKILPFRLGITIRDSCWTERIAMEQTIGFLREGVQQCSCCQTAGCQKKANPVVAIVGPAKSSTTIAVQNVLQVFRIPQIGYGATTTDLSDKEQFGYFLRTVPSDAWQAMAIMELLKYYNWTYIAVVYSAGNYGEKGFEAMERLSRSGVCIAHTEKVKSLGEINDYIQVHKKLLNLKPRPQVVVCFCEGMSMTKIFKAQKELRKRTPELHTFQWIGSDSWADRLDVVEGVENEAAGSFSIRIHSPNVESFKPYYFSLNPVNHTWNPWFREFWQQKFKCQLMVPKDDTLTPVCTGKENLTTNYEQDPKLSQVINSVRVVGLALKALHRDKCKSYNTSICPEMESINGTLLFQYMMNVTYTDRFEQDISFDANGDPPAWYDILNYVGRKGFRLAGHFRQNRTGQHFLAMTKEPIMFYDKTSKMPESVCSKPCRVGQRQRKTTACCWICEACSENQVVNYTSNLCEDCPLGYWPNEKRTSCYALPHEHYEITTLSSIIALIIATIGILLTLLTVVIFVNHNGTPVVKSTTRELSYIILGGIIACYASTYFILGRPNPLTCFVARTLPPIAFAVIYSALLTKTNRIARILAGSKKRILTKKPRFLSTFSQVIITWSLVFIQCVIVAVSAMQEFPHAGFDEHFMPQRMVLICAASNLWVMVPFVWNFVLIVFCTLYAVKTRNLPENFNEAKFIGFTMYCTVVVWVAFVVLYLGTVNKALTMCYTFSISATIALVLLFFPKVYIILIHPERNVRASYTTTKLIRCHFGNSQGTQDSKHASAKTRHSSQSMSISSSRYPTRTASLHIMNQSPSGSMTNTTPALPTQLKVVESGTQTEPNSTKFMRTFSVMQSKRSKALDEDVLNLIESCKRYTRQRASFVATLSPRDLVDLEPSTSARWRSLSPRRDELLQDERVSNANVQNLLLEEEVEEEEAESSLGTIEKGMRAVLQTVSRPSLDSRSASIGQNRDSPKMSMLRPQSAAAGTLRHRHASTPKPSICSEILSEHSEDNTVSSAQVLFGDNQFEQLLRSRGVQPVQLSNATQL